MRTYWHSINDSTFAKVMMHNARLREGFLHTETAHLPKGSISSPYSYFTSEQEKEALWESVRSQHFSDLPSRHECFFMFEDEEAIRKASEVWWAGQNRQNLRVHIVEGSKIHRADSKWLDCTQDKWEENANVYWCSEKTEDPILEIVLQGSVFFPDWEDFNLETMF